jgi:hypothetical protein
MGIVGEEINPLTERMLIKEGEGGRVCKVLFYIGWSEKFFMN